MIGQVVRIKPLGDAREFYHMRHVVIAPSRVGCVGAALVYGAILIAGHPFYSSKAFFWMIVVFSVGFLGVLLHRSWDYTREAVLCSLLAVACGFAGISLFLANVEEVSPSRLTPDTINSVVRLVGNFDLYDFGAYSIAVMAAIGVLALVYGKWVGLLRLPTVVLIGGILNLVVSWIYFESHWYYGGSPAPARAIELRAAEKMAYPLLLLILVILIAGFVVLVTRLPKVVGTR